MKQKNRECSKQHTSLKKFKRDYLAWNKRIMKLVDLINKEPKL